MPRKKSVSVADTAPLEDAELQEPLKETPEANVEAAQSEQGAEPEPKVSASSAEATGAWAVHDSQGKYIRTYTVEIHGEVAPQLAEQFAGKIQGIVKET